MPADESRDAASPAKQADAQAPAQGGIARQRGIGVSPLRAVLGSVAGVLSGAILLGLMFFAWMMWSAHEPAAASAWGSVALIVAFAAAREAFPSVLVTAPLLWLGARWPGRTAIVTIACAALAIGTATPFWLPQPLLPLRMIPFVGIAGAFGGWVMAAIAAPRK